jgi:hypothetical protein
VARTPSKRPPSEPADVPVNVKAEIDLSTTADVKVSGDAQYIGQKDGRTVYEVGSGHVTFNAGS